MFSSSRLKLVDQKQNRKSIPKTLSIPKGYVLGISWQTGCGPLYQLFVDVDAKGFNSSVVVVVGLVLGGQGKGQILRKQLDHIITRIAGSDKRKLSICRLPRSKVGFS